MAAPGGVLKLGEAHTTRTAKSLQNDLVTWRQEGAWLHASGSNCCSELLGSSVGLQDVTACLPSRARSPEAVSSRHLDHEPHTCLPQLPYSSFIVARHDSPVHQEGGETNTQGQELGRRTNDRGASRCRRCCSGKRRARARQFSEHRIVPGCSRRQALRPGR